MCEHSPVSSSFLVNGKTSLYHGTQSDQALNHLLKLPNSKIYIYHLKWGESGGDSFPESRIPTIPQFRTSYQNPWKAKLTPHCLVTVELEQRKEDGLRNSVT